MTNRSTTVQKYAIGGAWFFIVASVLHLAWVIGVKIPDPGGVTKLYHTVVDGVSYDAWGLTYDGTPGLLQALLQLVVVGAATFATVLPSRWRPLRKMRRVGHVVLIGWAGWWALNLLWLTSVDMQLDSVLQSGLLSALLGCTIWRAICGWTAESPARPISGPGVRDAGDEDGEPASDMDALEREIASVDALGGPPSTPEAGRMRRAAGALVPVGRAGRNVARGTYERARAWTPGARRQAGRAGRTVRDRIVRPTIAWLRAKGVIPARRDPATRATSA